MPRRKWKGKDRNQTIGCGNQNGLEDGGRKQTGVKFQNSPPSRTGGTSFGDSLNVTQVSAPKLEKFLGGCARLINQKIGKASGRNASPASYSITSPIPQFIHIKTWGIACWLPVPYSLVFHHVPRRLRCLDGTPGDLRISKSVAYARYHRGRLRYRWLVYRLLSHTSRPPRNHN